MVSIWNWRDGILWNCTRGQIECNAWRRINYVLQRVEAKSARIVVNIVQEGVSKL